MNYSSYIHFHICMVVSRLFAIERFSGIYGESKTKIFMKHVGFVIQLVAESHKWSCPSTISVSEQRNPHVVLEIHSQDVWLQLWVILDPMNLYIMLYYDAHNIVNMDCAK